MEQNKDQGSPFLTIGFSSLLVIFLILCMVIFAVLALSDARNNLQLSEHMLEKKEAYFEAVNTSEKVIAEIDQILIQCGKENSTSYLDEVEKQIAGASFENCSTTFSKNGNEAIICFEIKYGEDTQLEVALAIPNNPTAEDSRYQISRFQTINTHNWTPESSKEFQ